MTRSRPLTIFIASIALSLLAPLCAAQQSDPFARGRAAFAKAYAQVEASGEAHDPDPEELRTYPLYPYLQAARIRRALANADQADGSVVDQRAHTFITYYEREPVGGNVRRFWLASLAERKRWDAFLEHYRADAADDSLRCLQFQARIELDRTAGLAEQISAQWLTPRSLPDCRRAFDWLRERGQLTPALIEQRVRRALEANNHSFAREIAQMLPAEQAAPLTQWAALLQHPKREIDALLAQPDRKVLDEALLAGWTRLARTDTEAAVQRFRRLIAARRLDENAASPYALALALPLAWNRRTEALEYFSKVKAPQLDDYALEWRARAAMWAQDWRLLATSIAAMSDAQRTQARWRYWAARAAQHRGDEALAQQLYTSVLADDNFYSLMAAARLDRTVQPTPEKLVQDAIQLDRIEQAPAFVRARELVLNDMRPLADAEWRYGYAELPEKARAQAVHLAARWGWYDQAIATATQQRVFNDYELLYPRPFDSHVLAAARQSGLSPELIYSVMRQESLYRKDAISSAGARGLLQLLPETARRTARALNRPRPSPDDLLDPGVNLPLGAAHLRELLDRFDGQTIVALAGYNAGPNAAARWLPADPVESDVWIENIPYNETRTYVQRILWHNVVFGWLRTGEPQHAARWLIQVGPESAKRLASG